MDGIKEIAVLGFGEKDGVQYAGSRWVEENQAEDVTLIHHVVMATTYLNRVLELIPEDKQIGADQFIKQAFNDLWDTKYNLGVGEDL